MKSQIRVGPKNLREHCLSISLLCYHVVHVYTGTCMFLPSLLFNPPHGPPPNITPFPHPIGHPIGHLSSHSTVAALPRSTTNVSHCFCKQLQRIVCIVVVLGQHSGDVCGQGRRRIGTTQHFWSCNARIFVRALVGHNGIH